MSESSCELQASGFLRVTAFAIRPRRTIDPARAISVSSATRGRASRSSLVVTVGGRSNESGKSLNAICPPRTTSTCADLRRGGGDRDRRGELSREPIPDALLFFSHRVTMQPMRGQPARASATHRRAHVGSDGDGDSLDVDVECGRPPARTNDGRDRAVIAPRKAGVVASVERPGESRGREHRRRSERRPSVRGTGPAERTLRYHDGADTIDFARRPASFKAERRKKTENKKSTAAELVWLYAATPLQCSSNSAAVVGTDVSTAGARGRKRGVR